MKKNWSWKNPPCTPRGGKREGEISAAYVCTYATFPAPNNRKEMSYAHVKIFIGNYPPNTTRLEDDFSRRRVAFSIEKNTRIPRHPSAAEETKETKKRNLVEARLVRIALFPVLHRRRKENFNR